MSSDKTNKPNILLLFLSFALCICSGWLITNPYYLSSSDIRITDASANTSVEDEVPSAEEILVTIPPEAAEEVRDTRHPARAAEVSDAAGTGTWFTSEGQWYYVINNENYTGWLYDSDGKIYCFGSDGQMYTGWQEIDNQIYYFDNDGIMQAGTLIIDDQTYVLQEDGVFVP